jgi:S-adenosylmethionine:tRNA ribosyltransferase-isomerase
MQTADFDYHLPAELIAQQPAAKRDESRLLVVHRHGETMEHRHFCELSQFLRSGDLLVLNNSRVIPARLRGRNANSGGAFEVLLLEETALNNWWVMLRPGRRARVGTRITICDHQFNPTAIEAVVLEVNAEGHRRLFFTGTVNLLDELPKLGEIPLPPYITREPGASRSEDLERYQTVFAQPPGSVAAPTAGLHFTEHVLGELRAKGIRTGFVTLHVGLGTFAPVKADKLDEHVMHEERFELSEETARLVRETRAGGGRVIAVGTTSLRVLESTARQCPGELNACAGRTRLFCYPPCNFKVVDALLTNFHLPQSTLLMLVSAFASPGETRGREFMQRVYAEAIRERYRFFSYGDAMLLL